MRAPSDGRGRGCRPSRARSFRRGRIAGPTEFQLEGLRVVLAGRELVDLAEEVRLERPARFLSGLGDLVEAAELAVRLFVAYQGVGLTLVGPVVGLQPVASVPVRDRGLAL